MQLLILLIAVNCKGFSQGIINKVCLVWHKDGICPGFETNLDSTLKWIKNYSTDLIVMLPPHDGIAVHLEKDTLPESTRIPNVNLRAAVKLIEGLQLDSLMMARDITVLTAKVFQRDKTITALNGKISSYQLLSANYQKQISLMTDQAKISSGWVSSLQKDLKRQRTKTTLVGIAGLIVSGLTLYLATK